MIALYPRKGLFMSLESLKKDVASAVDAMRAELLALSHAIHDEPELALEEFKASTRLADALDTHDLPATRSVFGLKTSYVSEFGKASGPNIAILSEYDALPGIGHACGHNIIATSGIGAALALAKLGARLPGRVRYLGTPAEERFGGKEIMAREGAFDRCDAAMMIHPSNMNLITMPCQIPTRRTSSIRIRRASPADRLSRARPRAGSTP